MGRTWMAAGMMLAATTVGAQEPQSSPAPAGPLDTIDRVVRHTLETNPDILASTSQRQATAEERAQAAAGYRPRVDLNAGIGPETTDSPSTRIRGKDDETLTRKELGLQLSQMLFDGFATANEVDRAEARTASAAQSLHDTTEDTAFSAIRAYLEVKRQRELVAVTEINVRDHRDILEQIRARSEGGAGNKADLQQTLGRVALAESRLARAKRELRDARASFERVVGVAPPPALEAAEPPRGAIPQTLEGALELADDEHPAIRAALATLDAATASRELTRAAFLPRVDLVASLNENEDVEGVEGPDRSASLMALLQYNLYRGGADTARRRQSAHQVSAAMSGIAQERRQVAESVRIAWNAWETAKERLPFLRAHVEAGEQVVQAYAQQFSVGQRTLLDVLDTKNELLGAEVAYITGQYTEARGAYQVLSAMGRLLAALEVPVPEATRVARTD